MTPAEKKKTQLDINQSSGGEKTSKKDRYTSCQIPTSMQRSNSSNDDDDDEANDDEADDDEDDGMAAAAADQTLISTKDLNWMLVDRLTHKQLFPTLVSVLQELPTEETTFHNQLHQSPSSIFLAKTKTKSPIRRIDGY